MNAAPISEIEEPVKRIAPARGKRFPTRPRLTDRARRSVSAASWLCALAAHAVILAVAAVAVARSVDSRPTRFESGVPFSVGRNAGSPGGLPLSREPVASTRVAPPEVDLHAESEFNPEIPALAATELEPLPSGSSARPVADGMPGNSPVLGVRGSGRVGPPRVRSSGSGTSPAASNAAAQPGTGTPGSGGAASGDGRALVSGDDAWGTRTGGRLPVYPIVARKHGWEGTAEVEILIDASGKIEDVSLLTSSGHNCLDEEALSAAQEWAFDPVRQNGVAVPGRLVIPVTFRLTR